MANLLAPRLHRDRFPVRFWGVACLVAFALSFGMGTVWSERRDAQTGWTAPATHNR